MCVCVCVCVCGMWPLIRPSAPGQLSHQETGAGRCPQTGLITMNKDTQTDVDGTGQHPLYKETSSSLCCLQ